MKNQPRVSLIITNYNGARYITQCLDSIFKSSLSDCEVIFVDDGSTDKSREILQNYKNHPRLKLIFQKENQGPAKARNQGAGKAQGEYLFFLDVDTKIEKDCPRTIVSKFEQNKKIGALQAKLIQAKTGNIETAGHFLSFLGFPYEIIDSEVENHHNREREIFGARSAAFAIRKNLFEKIGCFDEDYFIYGEDTDLSWRVWLSGFHVIFDLITGDVELARFVGGNLDSHLVTLRDGNHVWSERPVGNRDVVCSSLRSRNLRLLISVLRRAGS